ncbi:MAG: metallophosphoesterase, partial [Clostridiales bacterium]|nr:metallophosphoesterase [Clostridiales bacterium]
MLAFLTALATLSGCASSKEPPKALSIVFASDLHHLSPEMTDYGENFMDIIKHGDGKVTHYTTEIT